MGCVTILCLLAQHSASRDLLQSSGIHNQAKRNKSAKMLRRFDVDTSKVMSIITNCDVFNQDYCEVNFETYGEANSCPCVFQLEYTNFYMLATM